MCDRYFDFGVFASGRYKLSHRLWNRFPFPSDDMRTRVHAPNDSISSDGNLTSALSIVYLDVNTDICNHTCTFCDGFYRSLHAAHIPWPRLERLIDEMQEIGVMAVVLAGDRGEPFLHPDFDKLLSKIVRTGIQYGLYTNGTCVTKEAWPWLPHAAFIRISADAATAETHRLMHVYPAARDDFSRLVSNVERLTGHVADVGISFVLDSKNYHEMSRRTIAMSSILTPMSALNGRKRASRFSALFRAFQQTNRTLSSCGSDNARERAAAPSGTRSVSRRTVRSRTTCTASRGRSRSLLDIDL